MSRIRIVAGGIKKPGGSRGKEANLDAARIIISATSTFQNLQMQIPEIFSAVTSLSQVNGRYMKEKKSSSDNRKFRELR